MTILAAAMACAPTAEQPRDQQLVQTTSSADSNVAPVRGAWLDWTSLRGLDSDYATTMQQLEQLVDRAAIAGMNTLYVIAWRYGCAKFQNINDPAGLHVPRCHGQLDYLQTVIDIVKARAPHIRVVPWFERPIGVGSHEPIYGDVQQWYRDRDLLEPDSIYYAEAGHRFPIMDLDHPEVRQLLAAAINSVVQNYQLDAVLIDDHLRLPHAQKDNATLSQKVHDFGNHWFGTFKADNPGRALELAPLVLEFSIGHYGTDWSEWGAHIDGILLQCYKKDVSELMAGNRCYEVPAGLQSKFLGVGLYTRISGHDLTDAQLTGLVEYQNDHDHAWVIFTLERLSNGVAETVGALTQEEQWAGRATAKENGGLGGAHLRQAPQNLSELGSGGYCHVPTGQETAFHHVVAQHGNYLKIALSAPPAPCASLTGSVWIYAPHFDVSLDPPPAEHDTIEARENGGLNGAHLRQEPRFLSELGQGGYCHVQPGTRVAYSQVLAVHGNYQQLELAAVVDGCPGWTDSAWIYTPHFELDTAP